MHRIVDAMVDNYRPEVEKLEARIEELEKEVFETPRRRIVQRHPGAQARRHGACAASPRRSGTSSRRLARREFALIGENVAYRFRDVYDHLVRIADEALSPSRTAMLGLLDAHLTQCPTG